MPDGQNLEWGLSQDSVEQGLLLGRLCRLLEISPSEDLIRQAEFVNHIRYLMVGGIWSQDWS